MTVPGVSVIMAVLQETLHFTDHTTLWWQVDSWYGSTRQNRIKSL
jgi:hypothetical protein